MARAKGIDAELEHARNVRALPSGSLFRYVRVRAKVSQRAAGREIRVTHATISRWEAGKAHPTGRRVVAAYLALLERLARETGVDLARLTTGTGESA